MSSFFENTKKPTGNGGRLMTIMMNHGHAAMAKWGLSHITPQANNHALDVGCGGGANLVRLLALCPEGSVTGVDYSEISVAKSKKLTGTAIHSGQCRVLQSDVSALPFAENSFELVTAFETVYFWPEIEHAFRQVAGVLKPGGTFLICNEADGLNEKDARWTEKIPGMTIYNAGQLKCFLSGAGFTDIRIDNDAKKHWLCLTAQKVSKGEPHL
ncbi:MAG: class I SAM-dependent methyltransferase [Oscillospiraceae bacterium]|nr:class I SAM-dependent methyltransferase [Oscillospiraceae bacterium]